MKTMLYQSPGPKARPDGTYGWKIFDDGNVEAAPDVNEAFEE